MTLWVRALFGMLLGSSLTLLVHPVSREYLLGVLQLAPPRSVAEFANLRPSSLPPPKTAMDAAYWLQIASEKETQAGPLSPKELNALMSVARAGQKLEFDNAFWPQMLAVLLDEDHQSQEAQSEWERASRCQTWNDLQTPRLLQDRRRLADLGHFNQAWTYGYVYFARSDAPALFIESYAKKLVAHSTIDDLSGLKLRYATICNGSLLRDGSRSIHVGRCGADIVELATYPPSLSEVKGVKRLWIAQTTTVARLRQFDLTDEARFADQCFKNNEAWKVHTKAQDAEDNIREMCLIAIVLSALPGSLMLCAIIGTACAIVFHFAKTRLAGVEKFSPKIVFPLGLAVGLSVFAVTRLWVVSACVGGSLAFLVVNPRSARKLRLDRLGPLFALCLGAIWLVACVAMSVCFIANSTAASALLPLLGPSGDYFTDSRLFAAVALAMLSLLLLMAPAWAMVRRQTTPSVLGTSVYGFSTLMSLGSLALCAFAGPLSVYGDKQLSTELENIVANEPIYYQNLPF
jgi:hypothetical protein